MSKERRSTVLQIFASLAYLTESGVYKNLPTGHAEIHRQASIVILLLNSEGNETSHTAEATCIPAIPIGLQHWCFNLPWHEQFRIVHAIHSLP